MITVKESERLHNYSQQPQTSVLLGTHSHGRPAANKTVGWPGRFAGSRFNQRLARWAIVSLVIGACLLGIWQSWPWLIALTAFLKNQTAVTAYVQTAGLWGPVLLGVMDFLQVLIAIIPGHGFLIAAGYVYGFLPGFAFNLLMIVVASQAAFWIAQHAGRPFLERLASPDQLDKWQAITIRYGWLFLFMAFLLPIFPTDLINFAAGLSGMSGRRFLLISCLGRIPGIATLTLIGSHGWEFPPIAWGGLILGAGLLYVLGPRALRHL